DILPDDPGHLVAVHLDDRVVDLDLRHRYILVYLCCWLVLCLGGAGPEGPGREFRAPYSIAVLRCKVRRRE
ncbi:MAG TPA: hypothetical protein PK405_01745, partial [Hyphomicrobiales bacterium]|nr:hypothetical protein [Hyphomicrobiales bacterium]